MYYEEVIVSETGQVFMGGEIYAVNLKTPIRDPEFRPGINQVEDKMIDMISLLENEAEKKKK